MGGCSAGRLAGRRRPGLLADGGVPLLTFRTVHDLVLDQSVPSTQILGVTARLVTQFTGSSCKGYTDQTRFVMQTTTTDGDQQTSDLQQTTVESTDGHFTFDEKVFGDTKLVEESKGTAVRAGNGGAITGDADPARRQAIHLANDSAFPDRADGQDHCCG